MNRIVANFALFLLRKCGYYAVATKKRNSEEETLGDQLLVYYTDTYNFFRAVDYLKNPRSR